MSTVIDFLGRVMLERPDGTQETMTITEAVQAAQASYASYAWMEVAMHAAAGYAIAGIQRSPVRIRGSGRDGHDHEEWLWNVRPNPNMNHSDFVARLLDRMFFDRLHDGALVVPARDALWIADGWGELREPGRPTVYENISIEGSTEVCPRQLAADQVFRFRLPETSRWRTLMRGMAAAYEGMSRAAAEAFGDKNARRWLLRVDQQQAGTAAQQDRVNEYLRQSIEPFVHGDDAAAPLYRGFDLQRMDNHYEGDRTTLDVVQIRQEAFRTVANCLRIPYTFLEGNVNNFEVVFEAFLAFFLDPIAKALEDEIAAKSLTENDGGVRVDTTHVRHVDLFAVADKAEKLVGAMIDTPNEIREFTGQERVDRPEMDEYQMTKNHERAGGGENNDDSSSANAAPDEQR